MPAFRHVVPTWVAAEPEGDLTHAPRDHVEGVVPSNGTAAGTFWTAAGTRQHTMGRPGTVFVVGQIGYSFGLVPAVARPAWRASAWALISFILLVSSRYGSSLILTNP